MVFIDAVLYYKIRFISEFMIHCGSLYYGTGRKEVTGKHGGNFYKVTHSKKDINKRELRPTQLEQLYLYPTSIIVIQKFL